MATLYFIQNSSVNIGGFKFKWNKEITNECNCISFLISPGFKLLTRLVIKKITGCFNNNLIAWGDDESFYFFDQISADFKLMEIKAPGITNIGYLHGLILLSDKGLRIIKLSASEEVKIQSDEIIFYGKFDELEIIDHLNIFLLKTPNGSW
ncbi:LOW QUALITY PROTEIN: hypothetical protein MXB_129, partial [Myxobolus squamalis]